MDRASQTACVLMLDLPASALGGIDLLSFTTSQRFRGIKNLPPGWHFVFVSSSSSLSVRHGAWFHVSDDKSGPPSIFVKKWDPATEDFVAEGSETEVMRWRANLGSIWREGLTPYRQSSGANESGDAEEESNDWERLTSRITPALLDRITGPTPNHWGLTSASSAAQDVDDIPGLSKDESIFQPEKELHFLPVDLKRTWREGATGRERTQAAQDRSWALGELIEQHCVGNNVQERETEVLGELQFTFLMILTLNNNSCLEQWKRLLSLLLTCRDAVKERATLFVEVLQTLRVQLAHCGDAEGGLFDMSDEGGRLLKTLLRGFRKRLEEINGQAKVDVMDVLEDLEGSLKEGFGWELDDSFVKRGMLELEDGEQVEMEINGIDEEDESGEYAPVVVELTTAQMRLLEGNQLGSEITPEESDDGDEVEDVDMSY
ncbi:hypothetical protein K432DRAFT_376828 [Lepidopterella palustris CBS 459.81]|uniref:AAR2 domain-containing protein n=1 Tax=Lepidopterella palustris CBS 459.81 TaxID=1314670 RepID=A0A8E2EM41_9PEZI|nr:hypothetical protein K432DRAFT_376828 [Lepidopterella palustris CBS 459.81]